MASGDGKDGAKAGEFGDWSECFCVVNAIYLSESTSNKSCFVLGNVTIGVLLDVEDPFRSNNVFAGWAFDNGPSACSAKGLKHPLHGLLPHRPI